MDMSIKEFLKEQWPNILTIVIIFITLLSIFSILGINFNPIKNKVIQKIVTVESFVTNTDNLSNSFCNEYSTDSNKLNKQCNLLTENNCNSTSCCIWLNGNKCVAGGERGPTFHTDNGKDVDVEYYSWKNKCYGKDC
jgi:hypothetical protein